MGSGTLADKYAKLQLTRNRYGTTLVPLEGGRTDVKLVVLLLLLLFCLVAKTELEIFFLSSSPAYDTSHFYKNKRTQLSLVVRVVKTFLFQLS